MQIGNIAGETRPPSHRLTVRGLASHRDLSCDGLHALPIDRNSVSCLFYVVLA